jgi:hypothetical protein
VKRAIVLAVALMGLIATTAAPAAADGHRNAGEAEFCFDALDQLLTAAANARGGVIREKDTGDTPAEVPASEQGQGGPTFAATVPVWFHVVSPDGVIGNVKDSVIQRQMQVLNANFAGTGFTYQLVGITRTVNAAWYELKDTGDEQAMKKTLRRGGAETLNVYATSGAGFLGWAYFPSTYHSREYIDGIVIDYRSMPGGEYGRDSRSARR